MPKTLTQQNLKVSGQYIEFLLANNRAIVGHLYKFTSVAGATDYFTDLDIDINWSNAIWKSGSLRISGLSRKISVGLQVDEQQMKIWADRDDTLFGGNFLEGVQNGVLDGATITRLRIVWPITTGIAADDVVNTQPIAVWTLFTGYTSVISKGGITGVEMSVKSPLVKLDVNMPRNYYQAGCLWTLFDFGCTLNKNAHVVNGNVDVGSGNLNVTVSGGIGTPIGLDGLPQYAYGRILFTTGDNAGLQVLISTNDAVNLILAYPLKVPSAPGDHILYVPGCSKQFNTCKLKWLNEANFRGFDKVPPVMLSV